MTALFKRYPFDADETSRDDLSRYLGSQELCNFDANFHSVLSRNSEQFETNVQKEHEKVRLTSPVGGVVSQVAVSQTATTQNLVPFSFSGIPPGTNQIFKQEQNLERSFGSSGGRAIFNNQPPDELNVSAKVEHMDTSDGESPYLYQNTSNERETKSLIIPDFDLLFSKD